MSGCTCDDSRRYRVTGEIVDSPARADRYHEIGSGDKMARIRCVECGGKVSYVGTDLLNVMGISDSDIYAGRCLDEEERVKLVVDLI